MLFTLMPTKAFSLSSQPESPVMEKLSDEFKDKANFYYADIDENAINSASAAGVRGVPTVVVYKKGQEIARKVGGLPEQQMREFLKENLS